MKTSIAACCIGALSASACAPVFSDLQSARLAGPGRVEVTPTASTVGYHDEDESNSLQDELGVAVAHGVHERVDLRYRYVAVSAGGEVVNVVGFGPKVALVKDHVALAIPVGFAFGSDIDSGESWEVQPTLIGTLPVARNLDLTAAGKVIYPFAAEDPEALVALNVGLGIGPSDKWVVRPEVGFLWDPGEEGHWRHLSIGFSYLFGRR